MEEKHVYFTPPQMAVINARTSIILDMAGQGAGKTELIGYISGIMIRLFPAMKGFIGANSYNQLSQSTLEKTMSAWKRYHNWDAFDKNENPSGQYVIDKKPPAHFISIVKLKSYKNVISFINGCVVYVGSLENYKAHDGKEFGWAHLDETKDTKEVAVKEVIMGRLRQIGLYFDQNGGLHYFAGDPPVINGLTFTDWNPLYIHTSPSSAGTEWINKMFNLDKYEREILDAVTDLSTFFYNVTRTKTVVIYQSDWNRLNLPANFLDNRRDSMTADEELMLLSGYPFAKTGNEYYPEFSRRRHVIDNIEVDFTKRLHVAYDFNIMPYVTQIVSQIDYVVRYYNKQTKDKRAFIEDSDVGYEAINVMRVKILREILGRPPRNETEMACDDLGSWLKINDFSGDLAVYGDASGNNRITGLPQLTQYKIIERILRKYVAVDLQTDKRNIAPLLRRKLIRRILDDKYPHIEIYFDKTCEQTIRDFEFLKTVPDGKHKEKAIDKSTGKAYEIIGHTSDALEGFLTKLFKPLLRDLD